jgi:hypothetical protein
MSKHTSRALLVVAAMVALFATGVSLAADADIIVTEIMQNPFVLGDSVGEWIEIHNSGLDPVDIEGWTLQDNDTNSHVIANGGPLMVAAGAYEVLCIDSATMAGEGVTALYQYTGITMANGGDEIVLLNATLVEIDRVEYDGGPLWPDPNGASMMWDEGTADNNVAANWATADTAFGSGDFGTPGSSNGAPPLQGPAVNNVYHRALLPEPGEMVSIYADVTDDGTLTAIDLFYQVNGGGFSSTTMSLSTGDTYTATIAGGVDGDAVDYYVSATDNDAMTTTSPSDAPVSFYTYNVAPEVITPIASVHADSLGFDGTLVTVLAQVYIPGDHKADGVSVSAYVQDTSNRGINIFGTTRSTGITLLNDTSNIVKITGYVDWYFSTVELVNYEVELFSGANPVLTPSIQGSGASAASSNEGTYVGTTGIVSEILTTGGSNPAHNFTVNDGSGDVVIRIDDDVIAGMETWLVGDELVAAGAGGAYNSAGQILVGLASDVVNNGQGPDVIPPTLVSADLTTGTTVSVVFNEVLDAIMANIPGNYEVYETGNEVNAIAVSSATLQADNVTVVLVLTADASGTPRTLRVNNIQDTAGNPIVADSTIAIFEPGAPAAIVINEIMQNPLSLSDAEGEWFEVYNSGALAVDMNGWTIRDLGINSHVINNGGPLVIQPGEYQVFAINSAVMALEGVTVFYQYSSIALGNSDDEIELLDATLQQVDFVAWDGGPIWPDPSGGSMQWTGFGDNNDGTMWASGGPVFGSGDHATPGAVNDSDTGVDDAPALITALRANYPNPFNPKTSFSFSLQSAEHVSLKVFDLRGRQVRIVVDANLIAGDYVNAFEWDGRDDQGHAVTSGTYFYRLSTGSGHVEARKMTLLR